LDPLVWLGESEGAEIEWLKVDALGRVDLEALRATVEQDPESVALISVMWANNEVGTVEPIEEIIELAHKYSIPVHSDAVQVIGWLPIDFKASGLDAMTISGHKLGGPMGVGALILKRDFKPVPVLHGGGQEREVRSGTLATHLIAGFGLAVADAVANQAERATRVSELRDILIERVLAAVPAAHLNGDRVERLPGNAHFSFEGCEGDALLMLLDAAGIECSTGSACTAGIPQPSHVLLAMGVPVDVAVGSLRFSLGASSTLADVDALLEVLPGVVVRAQRAGKTARSA
jgi:cysteine desulfurase